MINHWRLMFERDVIVIWVEADTRLINEYVD